MKDATGELSMTAVAVVAIAAIAALFSTLIWPQIKSTIKRSTYCSQAFGCSTDAAGATVQTCFYCVDETAEDGRVTSDCGNTVVCNIDA